MLERIKTKETLNRFGKDVVSQSRLNFASKNASGQGSRSIDYELTFSTNSFGMYFEMEDYMIYQDKGVSGKKRKFKTPFTYKDKRPPARVFDRWSIRRGLAPRDEKGRFLSRKSLSFLLANYIFNYGIEPSLFFTKAFKKEFANLPNEVIEAYGLDVENFLKSTT